MIEALSQRRPVDVEPDVGLPFHLIAAHLGRERPERRALSEDLESDALPDVALRAAIRDE